MLELFKDLNFAKIRQETELEAERYFAGDKQALVEVRQQSLLALLATLPAIGVKMHFVGKNVEIFETQPVENPLLPVSSKIISENHLVVRRRMLGILSEDSFSVPSRAQMLLGFDYNELLYEGSRYKDSVDTNLLATSYATHLAEFNLELLLLRFAKGKSNWPFISGVREKYVPGSTGMSDVELGLTLYKVAHKYDLIEVSSGLADFALGQNPVAVPKSVRSLLDDPDLNFLDKFGNGKKSNT